MTDERKQQQLNIRRTTLLASLGRAEKFLQQYDAGRDVLQVPLRLENLEVLWQGLEETQSMLEEMETSNEGMVRNLQFRSDFEPKLFAIKAGLISKLPPPINPPSNLPVNPPTLANTTGLHGLKLPTIALPEFDGDYQNWLGFHDTFFALIHSNPEVADIQKFHYLRAAVKGEAAQVIESISISSLNYQLAWDALVSRYSNGYLLKKRHLQALLEIPRMNQESAATLHAIVDEFERHIKILRQLGEPTDAWSTILEHLLCTRLHDETLKHWEDHASTLEEPTYTNLVDFLQRRMRVLESIAVNHESVLLPSGSRSSMPPFPLHPGPSTSSQRYRKPFQQNFSTHAMTENEPLDARSNFPVPNFQNLSLQEKLNVVNNRRLCYNCLRSGHGVNYCSCPFNCRLCKKRHHTSIHPGYVDSIPSSNLVQMIDTHNNRSDVQTEMHYSGQTSNIVASTSTNVNEVQTTRGSSCPNRNSNVFMLTVMLIILDSHGQEHFARALLDSGSQPNLMTDRMAQILKLNRKKVNVQLQGPGGIFIRTSDSVSSEIRSRKGEFNQQVEFLILPRVTSAMPELDIQISEWKIPNDLFLADPSFNRRAEIDMIIGLQHFFSCFTSTARIKLASDLAEMVDSVFGWIVAGSGDLVPTSPEHATCNLTAVSSTPLEDSLERFWKLEELPRRSDLSEEERKCEESYKSTVTRDSSGRYQVRLPRHPDFDAMIGESKSAAIRRFKATEARLDRNPELKNEYHKFMEEYIKLDHMRLIPENQVDDRKSYYLPHHPVVKESSTTTKVRVVFDGSARTSTGYSLNDALLVGPVVQDDLQAIILRFMTFPVALVADVEKMYRQVRLDPEDCPFQRIIWRFSKSSPYQVYQLQTVTYGLAPSSFLSTRTLQQLADDEGEGYPLADPVVRKGFYVDDCVSGARTIEEAIELRTQLDGLMKRGGFVLRKWASNKIEVLQGLSRDLIATKSDVSFTPEESLKTLGIVWEPEADKLRFDSKVTHPNTPATKRSMLSSISQLFDPLGLAAPIVVRGKMLMQEVWLVNSDWDQPVPDMLQHKWKEYFNSLKKLAEFRVDRYVLLPDSKIELHTFSDASEAAYGACVYVRSVAPNGCIHVRLVASKTKVAPLKRITLPRLELCGALVGAQLHAFVISALQVEITNSTFWCDSTVVLHWLQAPPNSWKTFIANRVSEIQTLTHGSQWRHVKGSDNPADLLSRGMDVEDFLESMFWMHGPDWLSWSENRWSTSTPPLALENDLEPRKAVMTITHLQSPVNEIFNRFSSFSKLARITAYCLRFSENARQRFRTQPPVYTGPPPSSTLTAAQISSAEDLLVRLTQADAFHAELKDLKLGKPVSKQSAIRLLHPFVDPEGVLRVGGRLRFSDQPYRTKHPAILPNSHPFTSMLIRSVHQKLLHGGGQLTLARIREMYWPLNGRRTVRSVIRKCIQCIRVNPVPTQQQIGQLPAARITPARPFTTTGVDYAGPIHLRAPHKKAPSPKAYICLFICFCTKAVHIELVSDLTTQAFLATLRRFISRRGLPSHIYSDNGKNFEGARNELLELYRFLRKREEVEAITSALADDGVTWHMVPPKAPHFGGLWEAAVKVAKKHLHRQLGNARLSFEAMSTILTQIEACMNSRPLVPLSEDPDDLAALTPGHFLIGSSMHALPESDLLSVPVHRLSYHQTLQQMYQNFWCRWQAEYLHELQKDTKYSSAITDIRPGRLVILVDEMQPPMKWPLARIIDVHPGDDGLVRVVSLKTSRGIMKRSIVKICLLPLNEVEEETSLREFRDKESDSRSPSEAIEENIDV